jgi:hypothetical protein
MSSSDQLTDGHAADRYTDWDGDWHARDWHARDWYAADWDTDWDGDGYPFHRHAGGHADRDGRQHALDWRPPDSSGSGDYRRTRSDEHRYCRSVGLWTI